MLGWIGAMGSAWACGGFFCDTTGVDQAGEVVVFEVDGGQVSTHVTVSYRGPADEFAWVVPVPAEPTLGISPRELFDGLNLTTAPLPQLSFTSSGCTEADADADADTDADTDTDADVDTADSGGLQVLVVSEAEVGPYDSVVLRALDADDLVTWLQDNGYAVPDNLSELVAPYLAPSMHFLALKLAKDASVGDMAPIRLTYAADRPSIPLQLTAVAATRNMPLTVYVLGDHRAVPLSYLHLQLNPLAWDFFGGPGLDTRIVLASDEVGGRGFVTLYAGDQQVPPLYQPDWFDLSGFDELDPLSWIQAVQSTPGFVGNAELLAVLQAHAPAPDGIDELSFYNCPTCYADAWSALEFDAAVATAALEELVVQPRIDAQAMLDRSAMVTRLQTAISPDEMTVDPIFGFNPDLPQVDRFRGATLHTICSQGLSGLTGPRTLHLPDGYGAVPVPSADVAPVLGDWLEDRLIHHAIVVEQLSESGPGEVVADHRSELVWTLDSWGSTLEPPGHPGPSEGACGCGHGGPSAAVGIVALALLRRRRGAGA